MGLEKWNETMKIVIAPDSYKESLSALEVATQIEAGFREIFPDAHYFKVPMADGGEGTVHAMVAATQGYLRYVKVTGPLGQPVNAFYGVLEGRRAVIEMAAASGLALVSPESRNPLLTTTFGTGELIQAVLDEGIRHIMLGIGGSATNDGGAGMLQALGVQMLDEDGRSIGWGGGALAKLARIDVTCLDPRLQQCTIEVACDVDNPLLGSSGASAIFGPQKGATPEMVERLDANLMHYARSVQRDVGIDVASKPGAGAGGGMGGAVMAFLQARLRPGVDIVIEAVGLEQIIRDADLVITGEGQMDGQSLHGKAPIGVARVAKKYHKPVVGIVGGFASDIEQVYVHGIDAVFSVVRDFPYTSPNPFA